MARLFTCGFETGSTDKESCFNNAGGFTVSTTTKRSGAYAAELSASATVTFTVAAAVSALGFFYTRFYMFRPSDTVNIGQTMAASGGISLQTHTSDTTILNLKNAAETVLATLLVSDFPTGRWFRLDIETNVVAAAGASTVGIYIDGAQLYRQTNLTCTDGPCTVTVGGPSPGTWFYDDLATNDANGSAPHNTFPGDGFVIHLKPSGDGDADTGTPTRGGTDSGAIWSQLDELPPNDATDYVVLPVNPSDCVVAVDDATMINAGDTILFVEVHGRVSAATATASNWFPQIQSQAAGTRVSAAAVAWASASWFTNDDTAGTKQCKLRQLTDPQAGGAWTRALLDTMQITARTTDGAPDTWVSALWALVEYVPALRPRIVQLKQASNRAATY